MTAENWLLSCMAGLIIGWIANAISKSRYSFLINLFIGIFGAILLNIFVTTLEVNDGRFFPTLGVSILGSSGLLILFHLTRALEQKLSSHK